MACPVRSGFKEVLPHSECSSVLWTIGGAGCGTPGEVIFGRLLYLLHCTATATTWNGDKKNSKWGPNGDFISSEMGTKWGPSATEMGTKWGLSPHLVP